MSDQRNSGLWLPPRMGGRHVSGPTHGMIVGAVRAQRSAPRPEADPRAEQAERDRRAARKRQRAARKQARR